jgi:hypothetical protein
MVASLDPSGDETDEDKRVTDSSKTTKSTNDDDDDDGNNNNNKKQERVIIGKEDNSPSISPAFIQKNNGTIPFIPKMHRNKILPERIKLRAAETRTKSFNQQNTALNDMMSISQSSQNSSLLSILDDTRFPAVNNFRSTLQQHLQKKNKRNKDNENVGATTNGGPPGTGTPPTTTYTYTYTSGANVIHAQEKTAAAAQPSISSSNSGPPITIPTVAVGAATNGGPPGTGTTTTTTSKSGTNIKAVAAVHTSVSSNNSDGGPAGTDTTTSKSGTSVQAQEKDIAAAHPSLSSYNSDGAEMSTSIAPMHSQVEENLNKKVHEQDLKLYFLKDENSKKDKELDSLRQEKFKMMLNKDRSETARIEEDSKMKKIVESLVEKNKVGRKEIISLEEEIAALKLESTNNTAATLLKMKNHIVLNSRTLSSKINKNTINRSSKSDSSDGNQQLPTGPGEYDVMMPITRSFMMNLYIQNGSVKFGSYRQSQDGSAGPAENMKLIRGFGDKIVAVDGIMTENKSPKEINAMIRESAKNQSTIWRFLQSSSKSSSSDSSSSDSSSSDSSSSDSSSSDSSSSDSSSSDSSSSDSSSSDSNNHSDLDPTDLAKEADETKIEIVRLEKEVDEATRKLELRNEELEEIKQKYLSLLQRQGKEDEKKVGDESDVVERTKGGGEGEKKGSGNQQEDGGDETDEIYDTEEIYELVFDFGDILTDLYPLPGRKATHTARQQLIVDEIREEENKRQPIEENKRHHIAAFAKGIMIKYTAEGTDPSNCFPISSKLLNGIEIVLELQEELDTINNIMKSPTLGCTLINLLCKKLAKKVSKENFFRSFLSMTKWLDDMIFNNIDTLKEHISIIPIAKKPENSETFQNEGIYLTSSIWKDLHTCNRRQRSYVNYRFDSLPTQAKSAAACLGYDKISWDNFDSASSDGIGWKDLTSEDKEAAFFLGYDFKDWAELQARKKSTTTTTTETNSNNKAEEENSGSSNGGIPRANNKRKSNCVPKTGGGKRSKKSLIRYVGPMERQDSMKANTFVFLPRGDDGVDKPFLLAKREGNKWLGYPLKEEKNGQMYECPYCDTCYQKQGFTNHVKHCKKNMNNNRK